MSDEGGDGGGKGGGGDDKGGGGSSQTSYPSGSPNLGNAYTPPAASSPSSDYSYSAPDLGDWSSYGSSDNTGFTPPDSSGDVSALPGWQPDLGDSGGSNVPPPPPSGSTGGIDWNAAPPNPTQTTQDYFSTYTPGSDALSFNGTAAAPGVSSTGSDNGLDAISSALGESPGGASATSFSAPSGVSGGSPDLTTAFNEDDKVPLPTPRPAQADAVQNPGGVGDEFSSGNPFITDDQFKQYDNQWAGGAPNTDTSGTPNTLSATPAQQTSDLSAKSSGSSAPDSKGGSNALDAFTSKLGVTNPIGSAIAGAGLLYNMSQGQKTASGANAAALQSTIPEVQSLIAGIKQQSDALSSNVAPLNAQSKELMSYVTNGQLPPSYQTQVDAGVKAAKARLTSTYASRGQSTDPTRNSTLAQELNQIDSQGVILAQTLAKQLYDAGVAGANLANQTQQTATGLLNTGLQGVGLDQKTYNDLIKIDQTNAAQTGQAISNFAAALSGAGSKGINLKVT